MKNIVCLFFTICIASTFSAVSYGQCDRKMYDELGGLEPPLVLLKRYSIQSRRIEGVPFTVQYSYVFTRGTTYGFKLNYAEPGHRLEFRLTDRSGNLLNDQIEEVIINNVPMSTFKVPANAIYYLTLYAKQSYDGCAVLQLGFLDRDIDTISTGQRAELQSAASAQRPGTSVLLKEFIIHPRRENQYSYVLTSKKTYGLLVVTEDSPANLSLVIRRSNEIIAEKEIANGENVIEIIRPTKTGIYYFDIKNPETRTIAMAQLLELKEIVE